MTEKKTTNKSREAIRKKFSGVVVSDAMNKTAVVKVDRIKIHPKYKKRYTLSRNYKVHDEKNRAKTGQVVDFVECRPLSKEKRWRLISRDKDQAS